MRLFASLLVAAVAVTTMRDARRADMRAEQLAMAELASQKSQLAADLRADLERFLHAAAVAEPAKQEKKVAANLRAEPRKAAAAPAAAAAAPAAPAATTSVTDEDDKDEDIKDAAAAGQEQQLSKLMSSVSAAPKAQLPLLFGFMSDMVGHFKSAIARANALEKKEKDQYAANLAKFSKWPESWKHDAGMMRMAKHWDESRKLSHKHYRSMLRVSHGGMKRLEQVMGMVEKAMKGGKLDDDEAKQLEVEVSLLQSGSFVRALAAEVGAV